MLSFVASAADETLYVTRGDDPAPDACIPGDCSFREAANAGSSMAGRQTIDVPSGTTVSLTSPVTITGDVAIVGHGDSSAITSSVGQILIVSAAGDAVIEDVRIFGAVAGAGPLCGGAIQNDGILQLTNALIEDNNIEGQGAGVCNNGTADLDGVTVDGNHALRGPGGGVYNNGVMTIESSTVSNNTVEGVNSGGDGAGIANSEAGDLTVDYSTITENTTSSPVCADCSSAAGISSEGSLTVSHSTISNNHGDNSAAIQAKGSSVITYSAIINNEYGSITNGKNSSMSITNSTISNNLGGAYPKSGYGGVHNEGNLFVSRSTIADNTAVGYPYGGFFNSNQAPQMSLRSNLISNNGTQSCSNGGNVVSQGGNVMTDDSCHPDTDDDVVADAMIGPLADNGGTTKTRAILAGSPAIDNGSNYQCVLDQRGAPRPNGATCDAGAFEYGSNAPTLSPTPEPTPAPVSFPMGDADCNDRVDMLDITAELRLATGLDEPSDCGRSQIPCMQFAEECFPVWTNPDCNESVDAGDVLPILMYLVDTPLAESCTQVGQYPDS
jgi:hypothetical protein